MVYGGITLELIGRDGVWAVCIIVAGYLSAEGAKNVSRPWLSPLQEWDSLTMSLTVKFIYKTVISLFQDPSHPDPPSWGNQSVELQ